MAKLIPAVFPFDGDKGFWAEKTFFNACHQLSDDWIVLHSQRYIGERPSLRQVKGPGEIDFVLLSRTFGVLAVEIKGGQIDIAEGQWYSSNEDGRHTIKNPFVQALEGAQAILSTLRQELPGLSLTDCVRHCVVFPAVSGKHVGNISTYGPREIIICREDLSNLPQKIEKIASFWKQKPNWSETVFKQIRNVLSPTTKTPGVSYVEYLNILEDLDRLTDSQLRTIRQLTKDQGRSIVTGGAGTGKTVLGMARAQQFALDGKKVLYICANGSLAQHLQSEVDALGPPISENLDVETANAFISRQIREGKSDNDLARREDPTVDRRGLFVDSLTDLKRDGTIDLLVVDEAQDISKSDLELLEFMVKDPRDGGAIFILGDPNQQLLIGRIQSALGPDEQSKSHSLDVNCRNTKEIASVAHSFTKQSVDTLETVSGIKVKKLKLRGSLDAQVASEIESIRHEYDPEQIVVLCLNGIDDLSTEDPRFTDGRRWELRNRRRKDDGLDQFLVYSARSFQGREAEAVVVALTEKSLLRTFPFKQFIAETRQNKKIMSRQESQIDLSRVSKKFDRFRISVSEKLVPVFEQELETSGSDFTEKRRSILVQEFRRAREMEFDPQFSDPFLKSLWRERQKHSLRVSLYSMMTRARVILSVVADPQSLKFIDTELNLGDEELGEYLRDSEP